MASKTDGNRNADLVSKYKFYKSFNVAMIIGALAMAGIVGAIVINHYTTPIISTSNYHFNVQYRVGNREAMNGVVNNSLIPILLMYDRHPTWRANIEFQGQMLEHMEYLDNEAFNNRTTLHGNINSSISLLRKLVNAGRVSLILVQYSSALALAYPYLPWYKSINYTQYLVQKHGINRVSNAMLLQEGQFFLGAVRALADFPGVFDTILTTRESLSYFRVRNQAPLYEWSFSTRNPIQPASWNSTKIKVFPWWILPVSEGGALHWNVWCQDGENVNTGFETTWEETDFAYSDIKMKNHENQIADMERRGSIFMTIEEWMARVTSMGLVQPLDSYVPETHWQVFNYRSQFVWMGDSDDSDDGLICGMFYKTYQVLQAVEILLNYTRFNAMTITGPEYDQLYRNLTMAWMRLADGMVTDTTGLDPRYFETQHAYNMTRIVLSSATYIKNYVVNKTATLNSTIASGIQIIPYNFAPLVDWTAHDLATYDWSRTLLTNPAGFTNFTRLGAAALAELPVQLELVNNVTFDLASNRIDSVANPELDNLSYYSITANFKKYVNGDPLKWAYIKFLGDFSTIRYSPTMFENETIGMNRSDYLPDLADEHGDWAREDTRPDNFEFFLPLSNGLVYSVPGRFAIVKNNSASHTTGKWNHDNFRFMQIETRNQTAPWQFFVIKDVDLPQAIAFANHVNTWRPVTMHGGAFTWP
nr:hypothetical protein [Candidatus Sigynarchaeum springense]